MLERHPAADEGLPPLLFVHGLGHGAWCWEHWLDAAAAAGYPAYDGPARATQKRYEGSDRQVRGLLLAELRSSHSPVSAADLATAWSEPVQRERALAGLLADGLAVRQPDGTYALPS